MMKKITLLLLLLLTVSFGYSQTSNYCSTEVFHLDNPAEVNSSINLTIENTGVSTMKITAEATDITYLAIEGPPIAGDPAKSAMDTSVSGEISITLTWAGTPPTDVTFPFIQWEKTSTGGARWNIQNATTPFIGDCAPPPPAEDATLSDLTIGGTTVAGFVPGTLTYDVELPLGTTAVPTVLGTPTQGTSTAVTTAAGSLPGASTVLVTAQDNNFTKTYTVNFTVALPVAPTTAPTAPTELAADVLSIYSESYTPIAGVNLDTNWAPDDSTQSFPTITGNEVLKMEDFNFQGMQYDPLDASSMEYLHIDVWTRDASSFQITPISPGQEAVYELSPTLGEWNSYDIPLTNFPCDFTALFQMKLDGTNGTTVFVDNIYFWKTPYDATADATLSDLKVDGTTISGFDSGTLNYTYIYAQGVTEVPAIAVTTTNALATPVITPASGLPGSTTVLVTAEDGNTTATYTVTFEEIIPVPAPLTSAPLSTALDADVLFLYSDVYTTTSASFTNPTWAVVGPSNYNAPSTEVVIDGTSDNVRYFEDVVLLYMQAPLDATGYRYFHIDIWSADSNSAFIKWEGSNPGAAYGETFSLIPGEWNSIDIDLDSFGPFSTDRAMFQLIIENTGGLDYYFDNIYFSKTASTLSIKDYEIEGLMAYPNPSNSKWTISTKDQEIQAIDVYNVLGKRVLSLKPNTLSVNVDASGLAPGVYITTITTEKGTSSRKLIKN